MATKTDRKQEKNSSTRRKKVTPGVIEVKNYSPSEEEIRELAEILYHQRIDRGEPGSDLDDWFVAESYLRYK
jgi:hypothetical protein